MKPRGLLIALVAGAIALATLTACTNSPRTVKARVTTMKF
jgi:hypothetical protein